MITAGTRPANRGFTLIELMVALVIVSILVSIGMPAYQEHVRKTKRSDGHSILLEMAARQEQYFLDNKSYASSAVNLGYTSASTASKQGYYQASVTTGTDDAFTLSAAPQGVQADDSCGTLTLNQKGERGSTSGVAACW